MQSSIPTAFYTVCTIAPGTCAPRSTPPDRCSRWHLGRAQLELCAVTAIRRRSKSSNAPQTAVASSSLELPVVSKSDSLSAQHNTDHAHGKGLWHACTNVRVKWGRGSSGVRANRLCDPARRCCSASCLFSSSASANWTRRLSASSTPLSSSKAASACRGVQSESYLLTSSSSSSRVHGPSVM
mgnify:CR=1 FL=1